MQQHDNTHTLQLINEAYARVTDGKELLVLITLALKADPLRVCPPLSYHELGEQTKLSPDSVNLGEHLKTGHA